MRLSELIIAHLFSATLSYSLYLNHKDAPIKVIEFPIQRQVITGDGKRWDRIRRRLGRSIPTTLVDQENGYYTTEVFLGTPIGEGNGPQRIVLNVDTGSSNIWVNGKATTHCSQSPDDCNTYGVYEPEKSSTYNPVVNSRFSIVYNDKSQSSGTYVTDRFEIGGQYLDDVQFGLADTSSSSLGVLGLGYASNESGTPHSLTISEILLARGLINLNGFSIWLSDIGSATGSLVFGGVDTYKYEKLTTLPIQQTNSAGDMLYQELILTLNSVSYQRNKSPAAQALLDTGTEFLALPEEFVTAIFEEMNAVPGADGIYYVDCSLQNSPQTMDFEFGIEPDFAIIHVPLSSIVYIPYQSRVVPANAQGDPLCSLGIEKSLPGGPTILGIPFLRSAYAVFDLTHNEISIGQATYGDSSNIVEIPADGISALRI